MKRRNVIYHGTHKSAVDGIVTNGIAPRTNETGNWQSAHSKPGFVYLTDTYALYYAASVGYVKKDDAAIIEIDLNCLDEHNFYPDEDFLSDRDALQAWYNDPSHAAHANYQDLHQNLTRQADPLQFQHLWQDSLQCLGTVAYWGVVPRMCITRYAIISTANCSGLLQIGAYSGPPQLTRCSVDRNNNVQMIDHVFDASPLPGDLEANFDEVIAESYQLRGLNRPCSIKDERSLGVTVTTVDKRDLPFPALLPCTGAQKGVEKKGS